MGGLTVLAALRDALPGESFLYLGDTARLPYGTKSPSTVTRYAQQAAQHLANAHAINDVVQLKSSERPREQGTRGEDGVKALVIACNTASGIALAALRKQFAPLPVFGVVEPGAQAAVRIRGEGAIMVLATESTIAGGAYQRALATLDCDAKIFGRACPLWVTLAEQGVGVDPDVTDSIVRSALRGIEAAQVDTLLLGCTHFPVFVEPLRALLNSDVAIVDSAATTAAVVASAFAEGRIAPSAQAPSATFLATDGEARFRRVGYQFLGEPVSDVHIVDL